jgi:hypothetical protein
MNNKLVLTSALLAAMSLIFANSSMASAQTSEDDQALNAQERKRLEARDKIMKALEDYEKALKMYSVENPNTDRRLLENYQGAKNKISGISDLFVGIKSKVGADDPSEPKIIKISQGKFRPHLPDHYKVTYRVMAGDLDMDDVKIKVSSDRTSIQKSIGDIFPKSSTKATFIIKATDPGSITAQILS